MSSGFIGQLVIISRRALLPAVPVILLAVGCSGSQGTQQAALDDQQQNEELRQKVDELEKQRQEDLQKQVDALKEEQQAQARTQDEQPQVVIENNENFNGPASAAPEGVVVASPDFDVGAATSEEAAVLDAAVAYYQAAELGDYTYTYNHLSRPDQAYYTLDEWVYANNALDSAAGEFVIYDISPKPDASGWYYVSLTVYLADGSSFDRTTEFAYEDGVWRHSLTGEEYDMFDSALATATPGASTPTASADQNSQAAPSEPFGHEPYGTPTERSYVPQPGAAIMEEYLYRAGLGDYDSMYRMLGDEDQARYTLEEWRYANDAIGTDQSTYELAGTLVIDEQENWPMNAGQAVVEITVPTDEVVTKYWWFEMNPSGEWEHNLNVEQIELLDGALTEYQ